MGTFAARDMGKEAVWRRRVRGQAESGRSVRSWCREQRVTEAAFYRWRRELARRDAEELGRRDTEDGAALFVPVHVSADEPAWDGDGAERIDGRIGGRIEIVLTDGRRVRVTGWVNRRMLTEVLEALALVNGPAGERRTC